MYAKKYSMFKKEFKVERLTFEGKRVVGGKKGGRGEGQRLNFSPTAFSEGVLSMTESTGEQVKTVSDLQTNLTILTSPRLQINTTTAHGRATLLHVPPPLPNVTHKGWMIW